MKINIQMPQTLDSSNIVSIDDMKNYYDSATEFIKPIALRAFRDSDELSFSKIQHILYHYNTNDMERIVDPTSLRGVAERAVRNFIFSIQEDYYVPYLKEINGQFSIEKAINVLKEEALSHRINSHPLFKVMDAGLSKDEIRIFLDNYYVNNRLFHLHLATLSLTTPLVKRNDLFANLYDELGCDDVDNAHPTLFLKNYDFIGLSDSIEPSSGTLHLLNTKIGLTHLSSDFRKGFGGLGFIEISMPVQMKSILKGLTNSGMSTSQTTFWDLHISIDERHGESWFHEMRELINSVDDYKIILDSGIRLLNARASLYDDIYTAINLLRQNSTNNVVVS